MIGDVRDRSREILTAELAEAAAMFCAEHRFDDVTVDDIARGIGVSRATFFRYFGSKEDAVVLAVRGPVDSLATAFVASDLQPGGSALAAVRASLGPMVADANARADLVRARIRMISTTPALRARLASDRLHQRDYLEEAIGERVADRNKARAVAFLAITAIDLAWSMWSDAPGSDLGEALDTAFALTARVDGVLLD